MNTILQSVEEILDGTKPEAIDMPAYVLPDYLPQMHFSPLDGGGGGGGTSGC